MPVEKWLSSLSRGEFSDEAFSSFQQERQALSKPTHHIFVCVKQDRNRHPCGSGPENIEENALYDKFLLEIGLRRLHTRVYVSAMGCSGWGCAFNACSAGRMVIVYPRGTWYKEVQLEDVERIIEQHIIRGREVDSLRVT